MNGAITLPISSPETRLVIDENGQEAVIRNNGHWVLFLILLFTPVLVSIFAFWKVLSFYIKSATLKVALIIILLTGVTILLGILRFLGRGGTYL